MYAVLKQDIISTDNAHVLASKGHIYNLGNIIAILAMSDITDAGVDITVCKSWSDAVMSYRVLHMERAPEWEGDYKFPWEPTISRAQFVGEAAARDAALAD